MHKKLFFIFFPFLLLLSAWSTNPSVNTEIFVGSGDQRNPQVIEDGQSGFFVFWQDEFGIYCQKINSNGEKSWAETGKKLVNGEHQSYIARSDKNGGSYLVYSETGADWYIQYIYIIRLDSNCEQIWVNNQLGGVYEFLTDARTDSDGNLIISTSGEDVCEYYYDYYFSVYMLRIDGSIIGTGGKNCLAENTKHLILEDNNGGYFAAWEDTKDTYRNIFARRTNWTGDQGGIFSNLKISDLNTTQSLLNISNDGSGGIIIFFEAGSALYAQRISGAGNLLWGSSGLLLQNSGKFWNAMAVPSVSGNVLMFWNDNGNIYTARADEYGNMIWNYILAGTGSEKGLINAIPDSYNNAIVAWTDEANAEKQQLFAQKISPSGSYLWVPHGVLITNSSSYSDVSLITDENSGAVFVWKDIRNYYNDVYSQKICQNGKLGYPSSDLTATIKANRSGGIMPAEITFDGSESVCPDCTINSYEWLFQDGSQGSGEYITHTFKLCATQKVWLKITDNKNRDAWAERTVIIYPRNEISASISIDANTMKANGRESTTLDMVLFSKGKRPIYINLSPTISLSSGSITPSVLKPSEYGVYHSTLISGEPGIATLDIIVDGYNLGTVNVEFTWLLPPINLTAETFLNRSLAAANRSVILNWLPNPADIYTPQKYYIYRSEDDGEFLFVGSVPANVFTYRDDHLSIEKKYTYAIKTLDSENDISDFSQTMTIDPLR